MPSNRLAIVNMPMTTLYIKNMVCDRCKTAVKGELDKYQIPYTSIQLGEVELSVPLDEKTLQRFGDSIGLLGFELILDKSSRQVNQIKNAIIDWVRGGERKNKKQKFSIFLAESLHKDYSSLSNLFSGIEGTTIEQYLIHQKIERAKELLVYNEISLSQIADQLNYSSIQHLSNQFKKVTGLTPTHFRKVGAEKRRSIDTV